MKVEMKMSEISLSSECECGPCTQPQGAAARLSYSSPACRQAAGQNRKVANMIFF